MLTIHSLFRLMIFFLPHPKTNHGLVLTRSLLCLQVTANNWESGVFILFLVFFALIAAGYVLKKVMVLNFVLLEAYLDDTVTT